MTPNGTVAPIRHHDSTAAEDPTPTPEPTHEEKVAAMLAAIREGKIDPNEVLVETYLFIVEMRTVMTMISSGKMGGLFGKLLGKMGGE